MSQPDTQKKSPFATGSIIRIAGPLVVAEGLGKVGMYDVVQVGGARLVGEVIRLTGKQATIQIYEHTEGLRVGEPVISSGGPFMVELGPGLLGSVFDGIQRPLPTLYKQHGAFAARGSVAPSLERGKLWDFEPQVRIGDRVSSGDVVGIVATASHLEYRILVPPNISGIIEQIAGGQYHLEDVIAKVGDGETFYPLTLMQRWPARHSRPHGGKLGPVAPLLTGQRIIDSFFPLAKGGTAIIPGGFGTGKTVLEQTFAKWVDADVVIYVGCGERGNEMADVLEKFPQLSDPHTGGRLIDRTVLVANTSNMPVAARETSIYTGITIAEYFRDMGYDVALMADSTSRWAEALREVSARLEEMPGEEGYPAYLLSRLAEFYGRGGRFRCLGNDDRVGSITLIGAVSPPGGDLSEPMTQNSLRVTGVFWGLDSDLANRRHFPAIDWAKSYSRYELDHWFQQEVAEDWSEQNLRARALLQREEEIQEIVQLIGVDALSEKDRGTLAVGRLLREDFLRQSAFSEDAFCSLKKAYWMLKVILKFSERLSQALERGIPLKWALVPELLEQMSNMREWQPGEVPRQPEELLERIESAFSRTDAFPGHDAPQGTN